VAIHWSSVSEPHSPYAPPPRHDGLPRHIVPRNDTGVEYLSSPTYSHARKIECCHREGVARGDPLVLGKSSRIARGVALRAILVGRVVVGVGFEPTNARSGRIYSPHPLATWIPYQPKKVG
jgi:hypothetical protein